MVLKTLESPLDCKEIQLVHPKGDQSWVFIGRTDVRDIVQETGIKTILMEKKWLSAGALQIAVKRSEVKSKGEKEKYKHLNAEFQRIARRDEEDFLCDPCKK